MTFDEWLDEIEVFGSRLERLYEDLNDYQGDNIEIVLKWLEAAYKVGYEAGFANYKGFEDIGDREYDV